MASLRQIRQRMRSIHNIHEITKAMGMIASFRFKKSENRFTKSRNYFTEMEKLVANLSAAAEVDLDLFKKRTLKKKALVVMTGDKGLCGAYNSNLLKAAAIWLKENAAYSPVIIPVAKVANDFFRKKHIPTILGYPEKAMADLSLAREKDHRRSHASVLERSGRFNRDPVCGLPSGNARPPADHPISKSRLSGRKSGNNRSYGRLYL